MFYEAELHILRETFRKCRIRTGIAELSKSISENQQGQMHAFIANNIDMQKPLVEYVPAVQPGTIYRIRDPFDCRYIYMLLPEFPRDSVFIIGPYLSTPLSKEQCMEWAEANNIPPEHLRQLESYYNSLPVLPDSSHLFALLDSFGERIWGVGNLTTEDLNRDFNGLPIQEKDDAGDGDTLWKIKKLETVYSYENELMEAVAKGQIHKADLLFSGFSTVSFEQRVADPLRNAKNYCIIMNTLLRKAAEQGGVHPIHLDRLSSACALKIEQLHHLDAIPKLMRDMFRDYCQMVRKYSTQSYSAPIQKALLYIESHLSENLSLQTLADILNISPGYLSTLFRKETGQTLTDFINRKRIRHAMHLLKTTRLQVQTVAQHCGIMDVQYFSKLFKKITQMTPKEYRESSGVRQ